VLHAPYYDSGNNRTVDCIYKPHMYLKDERQTGTSSCYALGADLLFIHSFLQPLFRKLTEFGIIGPETVEEIIKSCLAF
jgi:hypothetical protein